MLKNALPAIGQTQATQQGLRNWRPHFQELQVSHCAGGEVVISYVESGRPAVQFCLTTEQCAEFVQLLKGAVS